MVVVGGRIFVVDVVVVVGLDVVVVELVYFMTRVAVTLVAAWNTLTRSKIAIITMASVANKGTRPTSLLPTFITSLNMATSCSLIRLS